MPALPSNEADNYIAVGRQSAKGVAPTEWTFLRHGGDSGYQPEFEVQREREGGHGQEAGLTYKSLVRPDGSLNTNAYPNITGLLLTGALGADAAVLVGTNPDLADHTITPVDQLPYYAIEQRWADQIERTTDVNFTGLTAEWEAGRPIKLTAPFISGGRPEQRPVASAMTPVREAGDPFFYPGASPSLDGTGAQISKGSIAVERGVDAEIQTNDIWRADVTSLTFDANLNLTVLYEDKNLYTKVYYDASGEVPVPLETGSFELFRQIDGGAHSARLAIPSFEYIGATVNRLNPDGQTLWADVAGATMKGATHSIFAVVRNGRAAAY